MLGCSENIGGVCVYGGPTVTLAVEKFDEIESWIAED
jgi:hypothetical protein